MRNASSESLDQRIAERLRRLRQDRGWSLEAVAAASGVSRATLSRLETQSVSATATTLDKLCGVYGLSLSQLLSEVEAQAPALSRAADQAVWEDPSVGFRRRLVSPPGPGLRAEVLEGEIASGQTISYDRAARPGLEHHLILLEGQLSVTVAEQTHRLAAGDCLRFVLRGASCFQTGPDSGARYLLVLV